MKAITPPVKKDNNKNVNPLEKFNQTPKPIVNLTSPKPIPLPLVNK